jgi:hypothetical protein
VPIGAALTLLVLNGSDYYVGGELAGSTDHDDQKLAALLFAGKLHELLILASIATIVFAGENFASGKEFPMACSVQAWRSTI